MKEEGTISVLIAEDEAPAARQLKKLLDEVAPDIRVLDVLDSVEDVVGAMKSGMNPDLLILDIHLADGLSFEIFSQAEINIPVIFTTAYDQYAIKAFSVNSVDYLLKPVERVELEQALNKFRSLYKNRAASSVDISAIVHAFRESRELYRKRFLVKPGGRLAFVNVDDVAYFFSEEGFTFLVARDGERFVLESTLEDLESQLDPAVFFRINRHMIVSLDSIGRIEPHFNQRYQLMLKPEFNEEVLVSRQRATDFKKWLDQ
jgi:DNA-binding LytR/AlgR family response regulator